MRWRTFPLFCAFLFSLSSTGARSEVPNKQKLTSRAATDSSLSEYKWVSNLLENEQLVTEQGKADAVQLGADENFSQENNGKGITLTRGNSLDRFIFTPVGLREDFVPDDKKLNDLQEVNLVPQTTADSGNDHSDPSTIEETSRGIETQKSNPLKISQEEKGKLNGSETLTNRVGAFEELADPIIECHTNNQSQVTSNNEIQDSKLMNHLQESEILQSSIFTSTLFQSQEIQTSTEETHLYEPGENEITLGNETTTSEPFENATVPFQYNKDSLEVFHPANAMTQQQELHQIFHESQIEEPYLEKDFIHPETSQLRGVLLQSINPSKSADDESTLQLGTIVSDHGINSPKENDEKTTNEELQELGSKNESVVPFRDLLVQNFEFFFDGKDSRLRPWQKPVTGERLNFESAPGGERYEMETLGVTDGVFVFTYLGDFLSLIQPNDFPVEFVRDALWKKLSVVTVIMQSLQVEAGFVTCLVVGVLLSLVVPTMSSAATCSNLCRPSKPQVSDSVSMSGSNRVNCNRRSLVVTLFFITLFIGAGVTAMMVTNQQLSAAVMQTPRVLTAGLNDAATFVRNTQQQIIHVTLNGLDKALEALYNDLDDVEKLLGEPIQREVAGETGVDVALDALVDVATVADELSKKVQEIQETTVLMRDLSLEARDRLMDLKSQVDSFRRACPSRDRPLCDTIDSSGLEIVFRSDGLNSDPRLNILRTMSMGKLPQLAERMRSRFSDVPTDIAHETRDVRENIKRELNRYKSKVDEKVWPLENLARDVRSKINGAREYAVFLEEGASGVEQWRWLSIFVVCLLVMLIWSLLASALVYGCCDGEGKARSLLIATLAVTSLFSVVLWAVALVCFIVGGHGEVFICRPLYDQPAYKSLTELLDDPGVLYQRGGGFIRNLLPRNQSLNVPLRKVLEQCENDRTAYEAFQLKNVLDLENASDFREWGSIFSLLKDLNKNYTQLQFLDPELQEKLQNLLQATAANMTIHRAQISKPITGKDLTSFAKQLDSVANQIKDLSTASRIETLASRTRRVISANIQPLEAKKEELLYLVTALDVQITPLQRQVNQSISHLKTIQYYIDNQGANISDTKTLEYTSRLTGYLEQYRLYVLQGLDSTIAPCLPVWNVFHGLRHQMCRQVMDPLNGFWFAMVWCLLWLIAATPICIKLIHYFELYKDGLLASSNSSSVTSNERGAAWNTPGVEEANNPNW